MPVCATMMAEFPILKRPDTTDNRMPDIAIAGALRGHPAGMHAYRQRQP